MKRLIDALKRGLKTGLKTTYRLSRLLVPIYFIINIANRVGVLDIISGFLEPVMRIFGLPGEASLALMMGYGVNIYAAIAVMLSIELTVREVTIIALMISFAHSLAIETAVTKAVGLKVRTVLITRLTFSIIAGIIANLVLGQV